MRKCITWVFFFQPEWPMHPPSTFFLGDCECIYKLLQGWRCYSPSLGCNQWLCELLLPVHGLQPVWPSFSDPWHQHIFLHATAAHWIFSPSVHRFLWKPRRCLCQYENPSRSEGTLTNAQTSGPSGTNNRATFTVTFWYSLWTTASCLCHVHTPQCNGLPPRDWLIGETY